MNNIDKKMEDKKTQLNPREKFRKLANQRYNNTVKYIKLIGNLSDKTNYNYDDSDVKKIFGALRKEINQAQARFKATNESGPKTFKLFEE